MDIVLGITAALVLFACFCFFKGHTVDRWDAEGWFGAAIAVFVVALFVCLFGYLIDNGNHQDNASDAAKRTCKPYVANITVSSSEDYIVFTCGDSKIQHKLKY